MRGLGIVAALAVLAVPQGVADTPAQTLKSVCDVVCGHWVGRVDATNTIKKTLSLDLDATTGLISGDLTASVVGSSVVTHITIAPLDKATGVFKVTETSAGSKAAEASGALRGDGVFEIDSQWDAVTYTRLSPDTLKSQRLSGEPPGTIRR